MRKWQALVASAAVAALTLTACGDDEEPTEAGADPTTSEESPAEGEESPAEGGGEEVKIGVILPDSASSARWETADRPALQAAAERLGATVDIQNAEGDPAQMATIAEQMITSGVQALIFTNLDSESGRTVIERAQEQGIPVIDYDRLSVGGTADAYISFDNAAVGTLQGEGLLQCLEEAGTTSGNVVMLNGSPDDNNAKLFKSGYQPVLEASDFEIVADQDVPGWDNQQGGVIFEQMLTQNPDIDGVLAANDGLGNAVISVLKRQNLQLPVTGQDATLEGLQNILNGDQCMTVYKAITKEADAAMETAVGLARGEEVTIEDTVENDNGEGTTPAVLLEPQAIFFDNVNDVVADGFVSYEDLCTGDFAAKCEEAGVQQP